MLRSALWYVQQSGLVVAAGCRADILTLQINGAKIEPTDSGWEIVPIVSDLSAQPCADSPKDEPVEPVTDSSPMTEVP